VAIANAFVLAVLGLAQPRNRHELATGGLPRRDEGWKCRQYRRRVPLLLPALSVLTYLDRVCNCVPGTRNQSELNLSPQDWGFVTGAVAIAYALFDPPRGFQMGASGGRATLARIVTSWSALTPLTGLAPFLSTPSIIRYFFGAGKAGAYPSVAERASLVSGNR
jgi:hypothetical protein